MRAGLARIGFDPARFAAEEVAPDRWLGRLIHLELSCETL